VAIESSVSFLGNRLFGFCRSQPFSVPRKSLAFFVVRHATQVTA